MNDRWNLNPGSFDFRIRVLNTVFAQLVIDPRLSEFKGCYLILYSIMLNFELLEDQDSVECISVKQIEIYSSQRNYRPTQGNICL